MDELKTNDYLKGIVLNLPESPGIYQYLNAEGTIIYVGKAKNLKRRVSSYFNREHEPGKTRVLVSKIADIRYIVVNTEEDALLLENNLIKKYKPRYNVLLKDDKTYPSICVQNEYFPRVFKTRRIIRNGSSYYGPYSHIPSMYAVLDLIKHHPDSRRMIVSAWNPAEVEKMALPPCHALFQFYVADDKLSCQLYQRSCDMVLGVPFNIASYSLLTMMMAQQAGLKPGEFVWTGGDCHVYDNHVDQFLEQLGRKPYPYPTIEIRKADSLFDYQYEDFKVVGYQHHPTIKAPVAV